MYLRGGRWVWKAANGDTYQEDVNDTTPSKVAAANARAAVALGEAGMITPGGNNGGGGGKPGRDIEA